MLTPRRKRLWPLIIVWECAGPDCKLPLDPLDTKEFCFPTPLAMIKMLLALRGYVVSQETIRSRDVSSPFKKRDRFFLFGELEYPDDECEIVGCYDAEGEPECDCH